MKARLTIFLFSITLLAHAQNRPNILFCLADDWGWPHAGAYGDLAIQTPHFDRLAKEGILFQNAYVSSPSCTPSRNAFITGKYHWELGSGANLWSTLPEEHESFIHLLKDQGYRIGRNLKKTWGPGSLDNWIAAHGEHPSGQGYEELEDFLEATPADQPFFFWLGTPDPHRPYEKGSGKKHGIDPEKVHLYPHFPDHEIVRNDIADYYYEVERWDRLVGTAISELERRGLLENTIIIMTGDHGMPFPRGKGNLYDSGTRVPFALRWGEKIKEPLVTDAFISFADIAPTLLESAGVEIPADMTGQSFKPVIEGKSKGKQLITFGRERHVPAQEKPDMGGYPSRGLRTPEYLYIRNYKPQKWPAGTGKVGFTNLPDQWYADCDGGPTKDFIAEHKEEYPEVFRLAFAKRPEEELYDLKNDPDQINNVAADAQYQAILKELRKELQSIQTDLNDPRAVDPDYTGFDGYPYLGGGGGKVGDK